MSFRCRKALRQLLENGVVATMRMYRYEPQTEVLVNGRYRCRVVDVYEASEDNMEKLVGVSGFDSVEEWLQEAIRLHRGRRPKWILVVTTDNVGG